MTVSRNNRGVAHENGSIEGPHGHLKRRVADALALRGSSNFDGLDAWRSFIAEVVGRAKRAPLQGDRGRARDAERPAGDADRRLRAGQRQRHLVLGFVLRRVFYTVPSRLIGHRLGARIYDDRLDLFLSGTHVLTLPRGRAGATGPQRPCGELPSRHPLAERRSRWRS